MYPNAVRGPINTSASNASPTITRNTRSVVPSLAFMMTSRSFTCFSLRVARLPCIDGNQKKRVFRARDLLLPGSLTCNQKVA